MDLEAWSSRLKVLAVTPEEVNAVLALHPFERATTVALGPVEKLTS